MAVSMYGTPTTTEESYTSPTLTEHRQNWMRNVMERLLIMDDTHHLQQNTYLPTPSSSSSPTNTNAPNNTFLPDIQLSNKVSPLSTVLNEARSANKRISNTYNVMSNTISNEKTHMIEITEFELVKNRFYSDIANRLKEISHKCVSMQSSSPINASTRAIFDSSLYSNAYTPEMRGSLDSIPFIDEDTSSFTNYYEIKPKETDEKEIHSRIEDLLQNLTYDHFDSLITSLLLKCQYGDFVWCKIVFVFEFINKIAQIALKRMSIFNEKGISKLK